MPKTTIHRTKTITVRVGPNLKAELDRYAALREMSVGEFVRYCALLYMDTTPADPDEEPEPVEDLGDPESWGGPDQRLEVGTVKRG
jgi:hypothetical protein